MDTNKHNYFLLLLVVHAGVLVVDAQPLGYRRRRLISRGAGMYPVGGRTGMFPLGGGLGSSWTEGSALYPSGYTGSLLDGSLLHPGGLTGLGGPIGGIGGVPVVPPAVPVAPAVPVVTDGGATVVDDRSGRTNVQLNIVNDNNNVHDQTGANNVNVNQVSGRNVNTCTEQCGPTCIYPRVCMRNPQCPGELECRTAPMQGGLIGGGPLVGGPLVSGPLGGTMVGGPLGVGPY